ncbi:MAG: tetratricopeptide repeat protein [Deltaproteobacteria bacterium]|nr:tetratricopeptide repeat protein [Deltaproteobacteria bacterium]
MRALPISILILALACGAKQRPEPLLEGLPAPGDAPYELGDDDDLDSLRARFDALADGPARQRLRLRLAAEYARRIHSNLDRQRWDRGYGAFQRLVGLYRPRDIRSGTMGRELSAHLAVIRRVRRVFAKAGADHQAGGALYVLATIDPTRSKGYLAEIEVMFDYADDLNLAEYGEGAQRARPIQILESVASFFPAKLVVDRLIDLYLSRQKALDSRIRRRGADFNLIRAHGASVVRTSWHIAGLLARAGRLNEAPKVVARVVGIGDDPDLRKLLGRALAPGAPAKAWIALGRYYRSDEEDKDDADAQLAILEAGMARTEVLAALHIEAGNVAFGLGRIPVAVGHFEAGLAVKEDVRAASEKLAALYETQVVRLALGARVKAATSKLSKFEAFHRRAAKTFEEPIKPDLADAYAAMGQGLVSLGDLDRARRYLERSVAQRPTFAALEFLGTIELKRQRYRQAHGYFSRALELPIENDRQHFSYNRLLRLSGEASLAAGNSAKATSHLKTAIKRWEQVLAKYELSPELLADLLIESGKVHWALGDKRAGQMAFRAALGADRNNEAVHAEVVAFLIGRGLYRPALDAYLVALDNDKIGDEIKVYMSLWMLAEARYHKRDADPFASEFITSRKGKLWQDKLAQYATGRLSMTQVKSLATTRRRQSELLFYRAVIHEAPRNPQRARELLERVEAGSMILDFEYELAKRWLERVGK